MKKIINGVRYDTDKAIPIGSCRHGYRNDFGSWEATLYMTKITRRYFLAGSGGPMSQYGRYTGAGSLSGGEGINPMTQRQALEWAEQYLTVEEIEAGFPKEIQDA
jgi:hypothetical protein